MRIDVTFKYTERSQLIDNILEKNFKKIERRIQMFRGDEAIHLSLHIEKNPHKEQYFCRAHMYLPSSKVLIVGEKGDSLTPTINKAFSALVKQLDKLKYRLEKYLRRRRVKLPSDDLEE